MATNPKKSKKALEIKSNQERIDGEIDLLADCLSDIFDKYSILNRQNAQSGSIYWENYYKRFRKNTYHPIFTNVGTSNVSMSYKLLNEDLIKYGVVIRNLFRTFNYDAHNLEYHENDNKFKVFQMRNDTERIKGMIKSICERNINISVEDSTEWGKVDLVICFE